MTNKKIIVSLTSYPARFNTLHLVLQSLNNQTLPADKIVLWLSKEDIKDYSIPNKVLDFKQNNLEINIVKEDLKCYNKLIHSLKKYPNDVVITCDDDVIYKNTLIEGLYHKYQEDSSTIVAYRCKNIIKINKKQLAPYIKWDQVKTYSSYNNFPTGIGGILYPPNALHKTVFNKTLFLQLSPDNDDIWFKAMSLLNNTKTTMVNNISTELFTYIPNTQNNCLWITNRIQNDIKLKNTFDYFDLYRYID